jgi:acyl-CoA thioesterase FadM
MDTDAAGIYHWTTIGRFAEAAEAALFRALGIPEATIAVVPRVSVQFEFRRPLRFGDEAWVELSVAAVGRASLCYALAVTDVDGRPVADGQIVCCLLDPERSGPRPWPDDVRTALQTGGRVSASST